MSLSSTSAAVQVPDDERISMRVIRLRHVHQRISGIIRSFEAANKMLLDWSRRTSGTLLCEYEVVYLDGRVLSGLYRFPVK